MLKTPGTPTSNAICGEFKNSELSKKKDFYTLVLLFLNRWRKPEATCCVSASEFLLTLYFLPRGGGGMRRRRPLDDDLSWPTAIPTSIYSNPLQPVFLFCSFQHILHWKYFLLSFSVLFFLPKLYSMPVCISRECINLLLWFDPVHDVLETQHVSNLWETYLQRYFFDVETEQKFSSQQTKTSFLPQWQASATIATLLKFWPV